MKFSIRDLLLVTVIVALAVGWALDHLRLGSEIRKLKDKSTIIVDYSWFGAPTSSAPAPNPPKD